MSEPTSRTSGDLPDRWVVVRLSALGDAVLTTGVLDFWHRSRGWRFRVLTRGANAPVFEGHPAVDAVVTLDPSDLAGAAWGATAGRLARDHPGWGLLDLHGTLRSRLLDGLWPFLAGGPVRRYPKFGLERRLLGLLPAGWRRGWAGQRLLALNVPQRYALAVEPSPPDRALLRPKIWLTTREIEAGRTMLAEAEAAAGLRPDASGGRGSAPDPAGGQFRRTAELDRRSRPEGRATGRGPSNDSPRTPPIDLSSQGHLLHRQAELEPRLGVIALHPYATHDLKAWPQAHWRDLIRLLDAADRDWVVVGRSDTPLLPGHPRDLTNRTSLRALCGLLAGCAALVTGDSGPMHLATAVGTPVLALFGPTSAAWGFTPSGERDRVLELDLPCRPCSLHGKSGCGRDKECLRRIAPDRVAATLDIL